VTAAGLSMSSAPPATAVAISAQRRARFGFGILGLAFALSLLLGAGIGAMPISPHEIGAILLRALGLDSGAATSDAKSMVLLSIRAPRVLLGAIVGAGLGVAGAALQGLFRNPLADPGLIGVSTGAALAAALAIVLGGQVLPALPELLRPLMLPVAAFLGGLAASFAVYRIARRNGRTRVTTLLLAGVALNALAGAILGLLIFASTDQQLRDLNFWLLGSLAGVTWDRLAIAAPMILLPVAALPFMARPLNALVMGEREAAHLGYRVERVKRQVIALAALTVGAGVALTGVIGFVGLVVPHIVRLALSSDHRLLLPASALLGATLLPLADLAARMVVLPAELPVGILTSAIGGPFFLWLLMRREMETAA